MLSHQFAGPIRSILWSFCLLLSSQCANAEITVEQVTRDINVLASDDMQGRQVFSDGIEKAAKYIETRFQSIGLVGLNGSHSLRQEFSLFKISPKQARISINGNKIATDAFSFMFHEEHFISKKLADFNVIYLSANDNFRKIISQVFAKHRSDKHNQLIIIDKKHKKAFKNLKHYLEQGNAQEKISHSPASIFVVGKIESIKALDIQIENTIIEQKLTNIVGVLPGKRTKEFVLFSAHYDHLGNKSSTNRKTKKQLQSENQNAKDTIYNGANDNASGTAAILNLAAHFAAKGNNERSLMFAAFTAEEIGGKGSKYFSKNVDPKAIVAMINVEMIGKPSKFGRDALWMTGFDRSDLASIMNASINSQNPGKNKIVADPYPNQQLFYRSDNATLAKLGVPAHSFSTTQIDIDKDYHQPSDQVETLDMESVTLTIKNLAKASESLVSGEKTPTRIE